MKRVPYLLLTFILITFYSCTENNLGPHTDEIPATNKEKFRPQFHFTPKANWMNDPNGLVYNNGLWHLFYQHNPWGNKWGHMSWGHAVTRDLVRWGHLPIALYEEPNMDDGDTTMIFSGGAVVDRSNQYKICPDGTKECMVAFYTSHVHNKGEGKTQHQSIAFSPDNGTTWTKYSGNPILDLKEKDFRDPKVFWHQPSQHWIMLVALPNEHKILFYTSKNLTNWDKVSEFSGIGDISKVWECPDLFELKVMNDVGVSRWILVVSGGNEAKHTFGMQYFIGHFDGQKFTLAEGETGSHYLDHGRDFYAAMTWNDDPYNRRMMIGWMNNWDYANDIPTTPWKSSMSIARRLTMFKIDDEYKLYQTPVREIESLRGKYGGYTDLKIPCDPKMFDKIKFNSGEIQVVLAPFSSLVAEEYGLKVFQSKNEAGEVLEETVIGYDPAKEFLFIDRSRSGKVDFNDKFPTRDAVPLKMRDGKIVLHVFIDQSTIEVFANHGEVVLSTQVFPTMDQGRIELYTKGPGRAVAESYNAWEYKSIWE